MLYLAMRAQARAVYSFMKDTLPEAVEFSAGLAKAAAARGDGQKPR